MKSLDAQQLRIDRQAYSAWRQEGQTLFELLVALAIIAFVAAIAAPAFQGGGRRFEIESLARETEATFKFARSRAILQDETQAVWIDRASGTLEGAGRRLSIPEKIDIEATIDDGDGDRSTFLFFADGSASGGEIRLIGHKHIISVKVGLNGKTSIAESSPP